MDTNYSWLSLDDDEEIVWAGGPRTQLALWGAVGALVVPIVLLLVWPHVLAGIVGVLGWGALTGLGYLYVTRMEYVASTKYIYAKRGIVGRAVTQIYLRNIQDTTLTQSVFGTQFDHGTISFSTAGGEGPTLSYYYVDDPATVKATIDREIDQVRKGDSRPATQTDSTPSNPLEAFLTELRKTRTVTERIDQRLEQREGQR